MSDSTNGEQGLTTVLRRLGIDSLSLCGPITAATARPDMATRSGGAPPRATPAALE
jgi:hypothetical protein